MSLKLYSNKTEVDCQAVIAHESMDYIYSFYEIKSAARLYHRNLQLKGKTTTNLVIMGFTYDKSYTYQCITDKQAKVLSSSALSFNGCATVEELFQKMAISFNSKCSSNSSYWMFNAASVKQVISETRKYATLENCDAPVLWLDFEGNVNFISLSKIFESKDNVDIECGIVHQSCNLDWILDTPGEIDFHIYNNDGYHLRNEKWISDYGKGVKFYTDTTNEMEDVFVQKHQNAFCYRFYTSDRVVATSVNPAVLPLGVSGHLNKTPGRYFVYRYDTNISLNDSVPETTFEFASCPLLSQE